MSSTLALALCIQVMSVLLIRHRLGAGWLGRPVVVLVLTAILYQGVSALLLTIPSIVSEDSYRVGVQQGYIDSADLVMSFGLFCLVLGYLLTRPEKVALSSREYSIQNIVKVLDWRGLMLASYPLALLTYEGRGYNDAIATSPTTPVSSDLASTFLALLVLLAGFSFLLKRGMRWFVPILAAQSVLLAAAGERTPIIVNAVTLLLLLSQVGLRPSARQVTMTLTITMVAVLGITGFRAAQGRTLYYSNSGLSARAKALSTGLAGLGSASTSNMNHPGLIAQFAVRLDGNSFAGAVLQDMHFGQPRLGAGLLAESMLIVVPSSLWPSKLSLSETLNPPLLEIHSFGLQETNYLPTFLGLYMGYLGTYWLIVFLASFGFMCGFGERWLFREPSAARLVLLAGSFCAVLSYEAGLPSMLIRLRAAIALALAIKLIELIRRSILRERGEGMAISDACPRRAHSPSSGGTT